MEMSIHVWIMKVSGRGVVLQSNSDVVVRQLTVVPWQSDF